MGAPPFEGVQPLHISGQAEMRDHRAGVLQQAKNGEPQSANVSKGKGGRNRGGASVLPNDYVADMHKIIIPRDREGIIYG